MSGNSCWSALQTAPIVSDFAGRSSAWSGAGTSTGGAGVASGSASACGCPTLVGVPSLTSTGEVGELVLADLQLVAVVEPVRVDPAAVHVRAVERAGVVEEPGSRPVDEHGVVARDRDVVEEDVGVRGAADRHALAGQRERLAPAAAARADHERAAGRGDVADVDGLELAGLVVDDVGGRGHVVILRLAGAQERAALLAVAPAVGDDEAAFGAMARHDRAPAAVRRLGLVAAGPAR